MNPYRALSQLETRLEGLLWGKRLTLENLMRTLAQSLGQTKGIQPSQQVVIQLSPTDFTQLYEDYPYLERQLMAYLAEYWREQGAAWGTQPQLLIYVDEALGRGKIDILLESGREPRIRTEPLDVADDVDLTAPQEAYLLYQGRILMALDQAIINIGRRSDNHIALDDPRVSRQHCQLRLRHSRYMIYDLQSTHGLFVNGERVSEHLLQNGDTISLGGLQIMYIQDELSDTDTQPTPPTL